MWVWHQAAGELRRDGMLAARGYAGRGDGKNNPAMQGVARVGPLPVGFYTIGKPYSSKKVGPFALPLVPDAGNDMLGRSAFRIHGDSIARPGTASEGCIILPRGVREAVWASGERRLQVVA